MLFEDILIAQEPPIKADFCRLVDTALKNQQHPGDMLLWYNNGTYDKDVLNFKHPDPKQTYSPYVIGQHEVGHSEHTHYRFIHQYRTAYLNKSHANYIKELEYPGGVYNEDHSKKVDSLTEYEETTINLEMLVYLKFWESDSIIKKLYELVLLAHGESYDWHFKFPKTLKDKSSDEKREQVIREKIRDRLGDFPDVKRAIQESYRPQIRNAIAHSRYAMQGRSIQLHNYFVNDPYSDIKVLTFDQWADRFHKTMILYNCYIEAGNYINEWYAKNTIENKFEIRVIYQDGQTFYRNLEYRKEWNDWIS